MSGETANISQVANKVTDDIFKWFKWEKIPCLDQNFDCHKAGIHKLNKGKNKSQDLKHTHPVDVVFKYYDPYLGKDILVNTDLKSYSVKSIKYPDIKKALDSLGKTIDCARGSSPWQKRYALTDRPYEIRGMLFIYNYDDKFDKDFFEHFKKLKSENIAVQKDQYLHLVDPGRIRYLSSVVADMKHLQSSSELPKKEYSFFYPDLCLHRQRGNSDEFPATIENLCSPFMIIKFREISELDEKTKSAAQVSGPGYVLYYNESGATEHEFVYLLDYLSKYQILNSDATLKIRVAHHTPDQNIKNNFQKAKNIYAASWGFSKEMMSVIERVDFDVINRVVPHYNPGILAWRHE